MSPKPRGNQIRKASRVKFWQNKHMNRPKRSRKTNRLNPTLEIAIVTALKKDGGTFSLSADMRLVKSALLYADTVRLFSYGAVMLNSLESAARSPDSTVLLEFLATCDDDVLRTLGLDPMATPERTTSRENRERRRQARSSRTRALLSDQMDRILEMFDSPTNGVVQLADVYRRSGAQELERAIDLGLLTLSSDGFALGREASNSSDGIGSTLDYLLKDPTIHLMFDPTMSARVRELVSNGRAIPARRTVVNASRAATGAGLIRRLPVFPDASLVDVLDMRVELNDPLAAYRLAVAEFSNKIESGPFGDDIDAEIDELWEGEVSSRLRDLEVALSKTQLVIDAALNLVSDGSSAIASVLAGSGGAWISAEVAAMWPMADVMAGITSAALTAGSSAILKSAEVRDTARKDQLFYLLELNRRM